MRIEYKSNNSGGTWWLKDEDWIALEKAGWNVQWGGEYFCHSEYPLSAPPKGKPEPCNESSSCPGHRKFDSHQEIADDCRWLGCLAKGASKDFNTIKEALIEFEEVTKQDVSDEGCNCCGAPHSFQWEENGQRQYSSGEELLQYMYGEDCPTTLREAIERGLK